MTYPILSFAPYFILGIFILILLLIISVVIFSIKRKDFSFFTPRNLPKGIVREYEDTPSSNNPYLFE
ncbi:MAG: hypothetical protein JEZ06_08900 [Anaerolineaceae bacterium]|nr:hypothetical protein [Anaerolineaceae bacterium]